MAELTNTEKVACRTPTKGRNGAANIPVWKFEIFRRAIQEVLSKGPIAFADLRDTVRAELTGDELDRLGSLSWHVTTVKLELEVRGEIERLGTSCPQPTRRAE